MSTPTQETLDRITEVAKLRCEGATWRQIATRYGYKNDASADSTLTQEHPLIWRAAYEKARTLYLDQIETEAILTQRELIRPSYTIKRRDKDGVAQEVDVETPLQIRQSAAHSLLSHTRQLRAHKVELTGDVKHRAAVDIKATVQKYVEALADGNGDDPTPDSKASGADRDAC